MNRKNFIIGSQAASLGRYHAGIDHELAGIGKTGDDVAKLRRSYPTPRTYLQRFHHPVRETTSAAAFDMCLQPVTPWL